MLAVFIHPLLKNSYFGVPGTLYLHTAQSTKEYIQNKFAEPGVGLLEAIVGTEDSSRQRVLL